MAAKLSAFALFLAFCFITTLAGSAVAIRGIPIKAHVIGDMRKPDCYADGSFLPGIGPYMNHYARFWRRIPLPGIGGLGDIGGGYQTPRYVPGYDDTTVPNPGYEVPIFGDEVALAIINLEL